MPVSKKCNFILLGCIGAGVVLVLIIVYSFRPKNLCDSGQLMWKENDHCYPRGSKGPCEHNLIFLEESARSQYGQCSCPYTEYNRTMVYHVESKQCFFVFSRGFCDQGQWLTVKKDAPNKGNPICETNICMHHLQEELSTRKLESVKNDSNVVSLLSSEATEDEDTTIEELENAEFEAIEYVPVKGGGCARLGSHMPGCPQGSKVQFHRGFILPSCETPKKEFTYQSGALGVPASSCPMGSYPSIMGKCQPDFQFDFD